MEDGYPCIGIDLMASNLSFDESVKSHTINRFFTKSKDSSAHSANGIEEQLLKQSADIESSKSSSNKAQGSLFSKCNGQEQQQQGETYLCDKCNQHILIASVEEHSDYHFAMDLMNEERQQAQQNRSSSSPSSNTATPSTSTKKRKSQPKRLSEDDRKQKRSLFFQPKRAP